MKNCELINISIGLFAGFTVNNSNSILEQDHVKFRVFQLIAGLASCATISLADVTQDIDSHNSCEAALYEAVDSGEVNSINGLAIERDFSRYFYTERVNDRANIFESRCIDGEFQAAMPVFASHPYEDYQPVLGINGDRFCFTSSRPVVGDAPIRQNVWCGTISSNLADVAPIEALVSPFWDGHAVEIEEDVLLFASERAENNRMVEIFQFKIREARSPPVLVSILNSPLSDNDMTYDAHSGLLVFSRYDPETEDIDLFASRRSNSDWSPVRRLENLSDSRWNLSPTFTPDGRYLLFKNGDYPFERLSIASVLAEIEIAQ